MGTQKYHLNETVLVSNQKHMLNLTNYQKNSQFYAQKMFIFTYVFLQKGIQNFWIVLEEINTSTVVPAKSDNDVILCLQLLS